MIEIEAKFYLMNLKRIESRLQDLDARLIQPRVFETNIRFDLPDSGLSSTGQVLRLRQDTETRLTYKDAGTKEQGVVNRTEIEFVVEDFDKAKLFLEALGYQKFLQYNKYRTTYELEHCHIMLDELPYGNFVEIEGESVESIQGVSDRLSLKWDTAIAASYQALFKRLRATRPHLDFTQLTFAALNGLNITAEELSVHAADG